MERLHQQHAVDAVDEVDRLRQAEPVVEQHVHRARPPHDEREAQHAHQRRGDDRDQREIAEEVPANEVAPHQQEGDREADDRCRRDRAEPEHQRVHEGANVERVAGELDEVREREPTGLVAKRVVENPEQRVHEEEQQEEPDRGHAEDRREGPAPSARRTPDGAGVSHPAASARPTRET